MNWWMVIFLVRWASPMSGAPAYYALSDSVFFALPTVHRPISLSQPDTTLLDAAIWQATNEARRQSGRAPLQFDWGLQKAAASHAESMIHTHYYNHENPYSELGRTLIQRVSNYTYRFSLLGENIGQYQTINTKEWYIPRWNAGAKQFEYVDIETRKPYQPFSYAAYARYAVKQWMESPHHRATLLDPVYTHGGCAARLSKDPYRQRKSPIGRLVQNFGTALPLVSGSR